MTYLRQCIEFLPSALPGADINNTHVRTQANQEYILLYGSSSNLVANICREQFLKINVISSSKSAMIVQHMTCKFTTTQHKFNSSWFPIFYYLLSVKAILHVKP